MQLSQNTKDALVTLLYQVIASVICLPLLYISKPFGLAVICIAVVITIPLADRITAMFTSGVRSLFGN